MRFTCLHIQRVPFRRHLPDATTVLSSELSTSTIDSKAWAMLAMKYLFPFFIIYALDERTHCMALNQHLFNCFSIARQLRVGQKRTNACFKFRKLRLTLKRTTQNSHKHLLFFCCCFVLFFCCFFFKIYFAWTFLTSSCLNFEYFLLPDSPCFTPRNNIWS